MSWAAEIWLWALIAVFALTAVVLWAGRRHRRRLASRFRGQILERVLPRHVRRRRTLRDAMSLVGLALLVIAAAQPRYGKELHEVKAEGVDLVLAVDLSRSMDATDVDPSRLERARREILDLLTLMGDDRVGLVVYAGGAFPRMPLTHDHSALALLVRELDTRVFQAQGSSLGEAIRTSTELLTDQPGEAGKAILVLTDGEAHDPEAALEAAQAAADADVSVYGLIIGSSAAPIPDERGFLRDASGQQVMTTPDGTLLTDIARLTGGAVAQSVASTADLQQIYRGEIRTRLATSSSKHAKERWRSAHPWPLALGVGLLLLAAWIGDGRRRGVLPAVVLCIAMSPAAQAATVRDADALYQQGRYAEAAEVLAELHLEHPDDADLLGRLGAARYRSGDHEGAARAYERQRAITNDADALYNAGNAWYRSGHLENALQNYESLLQNHPDHGPAAQNRQMLLQELQQRRQEQPQQDQQGDPQDGDASQEGQPQQGGEPQQGDDSQDGQEGQQPQEPNEGAEPQDGENGEPQDASDTPPSSSDSPSGEPGDAPQDDGTRDEEQPSGESLDMDDLDTTDAEGGAAGEPSDGPGDTPASGISAEQADRILDGMEEGRPRIVIPGRSGDKPW